MWFRQDLRLQDNPALSHSAAEGPVLPVYILDDVNARDWKMGGASRWWLHHSLCQLSQALDGRLWILSGDAQKALTGLCETLPVAKVVWNRCYEPWRVQRDKRIEATLREKGIRTKHFNGSLLWPPHELLKDDGSPYGVFTPFYRKLSRMTPMGELSPRPSTMRLVECPQPADRIRALRLTPQVPWDAEFHNTWIPGEQGGLDLFRRFLQSKLHSYSEKRDVPATSATSALSPYLHFGEISPLRLWLEARLMVAETDPDPWLRQVCWREFSHHLLSHHPQMCDKNLKRDFDEFPWGGASQQLQRWQHGTTGYPLVDAGMRELWRTGTMHNRVRMVTASFLTKNLMVHWLQGARWFWDCLVDADLANNSFGWQWVAGCGADAAPYFRIFNPITQSRKFDPQGEYLRTWLPELRRLQDRDIHAPWEADAGVLRAAGVNLGEHYPTPMIDLKASREEALAAWRARGGAEAR